MASSADAVVVPSSVPFAEGLRVAAEIGERGRMLDVAIALASAGWKVFPCHPRTKQPLVAGGFKARSKDLERVTRWWAGHSDATVGIVPGDGGLVVLDVDSVKALEAVRAAGLLSEGFIHALAKGSLGSEHGLVVGTGGKSAPFEFDGATIPPMHLYLSATEAPPRLPGVVVRYQSGYVIAPGSRGERSYRLLSSGDPHAFRPATTNAQTLTQTALDPAAVHARLQALRAPNIERVRDAVAYLPNYDHTDRDHFVTAAHAIKGACGPEGELEGLEIFLDWAARWTGGPVDPAEDERVYRTIRPESIRLGWSYVWQQAARFGFDARAEAQADARAELTADPNVAPPPFAAVDETTLFKQMVTAVSEAKDPLNRMLATSRLRNRFKLTPQEIAQALTAIGSPRKTGEAACWPLATLRQRPELLASPTPAIPFLAWPGLKTLLSAREKIGKTTLAMSAAAAASCGRRFLDQEVSPQRVLWLSEESLAIITQRAIAMNADPERFYIGTFTANPSAQLQRAVEDAQPSVVVIDTLYRYAGVENENDSATWLPVFALFDTLTRDKNIALLLIAHAAKSSTTGGYRGSSAIGGHVDAVLSMYAPNAGSTRRIEGVGRLNIARTFSVRLLDSATEFALIAEEGSGAEQAKERARAEEIVSWLRDHPGASVRDVRDAMGRGRDLTDRALKLLKAEARIGAANPGLRCLTPSEQASREFGAGPLGAPESDPGVEP